jgi:hypothetical protein
MAKTNKVPKRIAGVKLPKPLRRGLRDLAASQNGRTVLVEALAAAGAALAASQAQPGSKTRKAAAENAPKVGAAAENLRARAGETRDATIAALEDAARSFTDTLRRRAASEPPAQSTTAPSSAATH